jgi:peptidylprolyl isomerase
MIRLTALLLALLLVTAGAFACGDDDEEDIPEDNETTAASSPADGEEETDDATVPAMTAPATPPEIDGEVITTDSGLQYIEITEGTGNMPTMASAVVVHYTGWLEADGTKFDSSVDRGEPASFQMNGVIPGFSEGLLTMKEGGKRRLIIPPELGYGAAGSPPVIPPNATLIFDIELITVI